MSDQNTPATYAGRDIDSQEEAEVGSNTVQVGRDSFCAFLSITTYHFQPKELEISSEVSDKMPPRKPSKRTKTKQKYHMSECRQLRWPKRSSRLPWTRILHR
jgi:hypothetical protein